MSIELVPLCTATITLTAPFLIPATPTGTRVIAEVEDFVTEGRLRSKLKGRAAADWMTVSPTMVGTIDVRTLLETDDGAQVFVWYHGRLDLSGGPGAAPVYSAPLFETDDERYAWLNTVQAVAKGQLASDGSEIVYEMYEVR